MKAAVYRKFGPPEVLQIEDVEKPVPSEDQVLIRIYATTVAKEDPSVRKAPGINGFIKPRKKIIGFYLSGEIEDIGGKVSKYKIGDRVFGSPGMGLGTYAEYKCMSETGALAIIPAGMSYQEAAAIPNGALTTIPFLRDKGKIKSGQKILINGASGTVGVSAVQLAKYYGTEVTGVCSTTNIDLVKSLGADFVIDYTTEDFTKSGNKYDIIFDAVGKSSFSRCKNILNKGGIYLTTMPALGSMILALLTSSSAGKKVKFAATGLRPPRKKIPDLNFIKELIEAGKMKAVIDREYSLEEIREAHIYVETGRKKGDVVITM